MSIFRRDDQLGFPAANDKTMAKLVGLLQKKSHYQQTAATLSATTLGQFEIIGDVGDVYAVVNATGGALGPGESMVYDITVAGASILTSTFTVNSSTDLTKQITFTTIDPNKVGGKVGQVAAVVRTYTPGGSPTMLDNTVTMEYSDHTY